MNYIKTLESIGAARAERLQAIHESIEWMRAHLLSDKFKGQDLNGDRKDWVATADVLHWIESLRTI